MSDSRRSFLIRSVGASGAAWLAANWPTEVAAAEKAQAMGGFTYFTPDQAREIDAMAAQIYPTTDTPGAREAQVIYFIDLALVTFAKDKQDIYAKGFGELSQASGGKAFSSLSSDEQIRILTASRRRPSSRRCATTPSWACSPRPSMAAISSKVGWKQIGFDDSLNFRAPFGAYDQA